ncbi:MAG: SDR family NAD(P)-dependent oxidoreductase [Planctomycetota bacterium]|nr:SDR family oxidoreductase [Planctomycetota bacterium]
MVNCIPEVFIAGANADIGNALLRNFAADGWRVGGTYRNTSPELTGAPDSAEPFFIACDFSLPGFAGEVAERYTSAGREWDVFISAVGTMLPVGPFMETPFADWEQGLRVNLLSQLELVHSLYPYRRPDKVAHVVLLAGGGTNGPFRNYSAYCLSKIGLIKACELLDDECADLNAFIVGPGWVRTKIHAETLVSGARAGENQARTRDFLDSGDSGTAHDVIYRCIRWGIEAGREVAGGRNFSVVHDPWREAGFSARLKADGNLCKLRRSNPQ